MKLLSLSLILGLALSLTTGALSSETSIDVKAPTSLCSIVEKGKAIQAGIFESSLLSIQLRFDTLTERETTIKRLRSLFEIHLAAPPPVGYECILEDIRANPDAEAAAKELFNMERLIQFINSPESEAAAVEYVVARLEERRRQVLATRRTIIGERITDLRGFSETSRALLGQLEQAFADGLEKLKRYRDDQAISRWILESPLPTEPSRPEPTIATPLPLLADAIQDYLDFKKTVNEEEIDVLKTTISLLTSNNNKLAALLEEIKAVSGSEAEQTLLNDMCEALEKDIAETIKLIDAKQSLL